MGLALEIERFKNAVSARIGKLSELETTDKTDIVSAINEVKSNNLQVETVVNDLVESEVSSIELELDFGYPAVYEAEFNINITGLTPGRKLKVWQSANAPEGKDSDYLFDDPLIIFAIAETDNLKIRAKAADGQKYGGKFKIIYQLL